MQIYEAVWLFLNLIWTTTATVFSVCDLLLGYSPLFSSVLSHFPMLMSEAMSYEVAPAPVLLPEDEVVLKDLPNPLYDQDSTNASTPAGYEALYTSKQSSMEH